MVNFLGLIGAIILLFISLIHFYWAFGGKWGIKSVIPSVENEKKVFEPGWLATVIVAIVMLGCSLLYAEGSNFIEVTFISKNVIKYTVMIFSVIFMLRALGDFKYVGFFKKIKNTPFAVNDTRYYSPLCLFLGSIGLLMSF
ncbi:DUF3995 domain-containing protein [Tenacibaculum sp. TC6]|uniref:DUF3995 domain-containing protein n=1 Tax=Tenacibaculum sp. TC6 TaxID=3423223 RepID=UPI003D35C5C8